MKNKSLYQLMCEDIRKEQDRLMIKTLKRILLEQEETSPKESGVDTSEDPVQLREPKVRARPAKDSIDDQVDALILRYESASIRKEPSLNESLKELNLRFLLEQDAEEEAVEPPAEEEAVEPTAEEEQEVEPPAEEEQEVEPTGSEEMTISKPADKQNIPDLDIDKFTMRVVRLVMNHSNLLNIEEAIINRTKNFLDENYGDVFVQQFLESLSGKYGLETSDYSNIPDVQDDNFAIGAFAGGTGGLGGGGGG